MSLHIWAFAQYFLYFFGLYLQTPYRTICGHIADTLRAHFYKMITGNIKVLKLITT